MSEELTTWINGFWKETGRPEKVERGQVWTIFGAEGIEGPHADRGTLVVVLSSDVTTSEVVPAHHEVKIRTFIDPVLSQKESQLDFDDRIVCVAHLPQTLNSHAFDKARFLGNLTDKGWQDVSSAVRDFYDILDELARTQYLDATGSIQENDIENAFNAGILKLYQIGRAHV